MADSENQQPVDTTRQVTKPKNPKRVAAGKAVAEKTRQAREVQKKALAEAQIIIANQKKSDPPVAAPVAATLVADPPVAAPVESTRNVLTTTQWLSVISILVSLSGIYNKREEIKALFAKPRPPHLLMSPLNLPVLPLNLSMLPHNLSRLKKEEASAPWIKKIIELSSLFL